MADQLRVAVVGTGFIGRVHARSARVAGACLVSVSASSSDRSLVAARELGAERAAMWEDAVGADDVDVVHVCTPNHLHAEQALAALEAGKHVVLEKPVAVDRASAEKIARAARDADRVVTVPFVYRYYPTVREARARIASGAIGAVRLLHGSYLQDWLLSDSDDNWRVDAEFGGASRAFADIGSHWCDLVEFASGHRISRLSARLVTVNPERARHAHQETFTTVGDGGERRRVTTEDVAMLHLETDRGAHGSVLISQISAGRKNRLWVEFDGALASIAFDQEHPESLWIGERGAATVIARDPASLSDAAAPYATLPGGHPQGYHDCFDAFVAESYETMRGSIVDGLPQIDDGVRAAALTDAVLRSAERDTWVEVEA